MVRAVPRQYLVTARVQARHAHRVLDRVCPTVGEEDLVQLARRALGDQPGRFRAGRVGVLRRHRAQLGSLFGNGGNDFRVLVADVGVDQLTGEVQQPVALAVPHVRPRRRRDRHGRDLGLSRPGMENMGPVQFVGTGGLGARILDGQSVGQHGGVVSLVNQAHDQVSHS